MLKQKTIIHLVRHGAVDNPENVRYGRLPHFHLSDEGRKTVQSASAFFVGKPITTIYSSPMERTQQTATIIGLTLPHSPIRLDDRLLEVKTSAQYEGQTRDHGFAYPTKTTADAETQGDIITRFQHFMEEKVVQHNGQEIVAVSHADPIALYKNWTLFHASSFEGELYPHFASIMTFVFEGISVRSCWYHGALGKRA